VQSFARVPQSAKHASSPQRREAAPRALLHAPQRLNRAACACGGTCPNCRGETRVATNLQPKLTVNEPGDAFEQEADRVADQVMRMADPNPPADPLPSAKPDSTQRLQRRTTDPHRPATAPPIVHEVLRSPGQPLDASTRAFMERRFGRDFGDVQVHVGGKADQSARAVRALAYTVGRDIVFGAGNYKTSTTEGKRLLAHELTHTMQQSGGTSTGTAIGFSRNSVAPTVQSQSVRVARQDGGADAGVPDAGESLPGSVADPEPTDAGVPEQIQDAGESLPDGVADPQPAPAADEAAPQRICGPDITNSLTTMLGTVEPWFMTLTGFEQSRSCMALGPGGFLALVNPGMAWDTRELFLPNTGWLDPYFRRRSCGSPRDPGCETDPERHLCETAGTCGNSVVVDGKCMLAGTANYALFGKMCRVCHDHTGRWNRWDMRATIAAWKTIDWDDSTPPKEVASAAYDGTFPSVPATAENRATCTGRCGLTHGGAFDFIWEPYRPR
jgi:hypothetical protein